MNITKKLCIKILKIVIKIMIINNLTSLSISKSYKRHILLPDKWRSK